jgi:hypothetical protein
VCIYMYTCITPVQTVHFERTAGHSIPEDGALNNDRCENLKSCRMISI